MSMLPPLTAETLWAIIRGEIPDETVNALLWQCLGYRQDDSGRWDNSKVAPEWSSTYPEPPDFIGSRPATVKLTRSIPPEHKQLLKEQLGFEGYKVHELNPTLTRRATAVNWLLSYMSLNPPRRMSALLAYQITQGAQVADHVVTSFGNDTQALTAAQSSVALYNRSHWGRLRVFDQDRLTFLHNQSSNDFKQLQPGQGCEAVILTSTARTIDLVSAYVTDEEVILLTAPNRRQQLLTWFDRYIFFGDKVQLADLTDTTVCFSLIGPQSPALLQQLGVTERPQSFNNHWITAIAGISVRVAAGSGLPSPGYTCIADVADGLALWQTLSQTGAVPLGEQAWEQLRVQQGRPKPGAELTEDYNPLEAGLWHTVSFNKGCYIGQETIARLNTYNGVKQQLWGLHCPSSIEPGTALTLEGQKVGVVTSVVPFEQGYLGLGYIKTKAGGAGLTVRAGDQDVIVIKVPFLSRSVAPSTV